MTDIIPTVTVPEGAQGLWSVERFEVDLNSIEALRLKWSGRPIEEGTYTRLRHNTRGVVMSDTPAERLDHHEFVRAAKGHCLVTGLGIGMCVSAILKKPEVEQVTVVEVDADVIALVAPHFANERVNIVHASAFDYEPPEGVRYGAVWHDIWDAICADNLEEMGMLFSKFDGRADWQDAWAREECEEQEMYE